MTVINIDFSLEAKNAKAEALSELVYQQWKSRKRLELIISDSMDNLEELSLQIGYKPSAFGFEDVQIFPPERETVADLVVKESA